MFYFYREIDEFDINIILDLNRLANSISTKTPLAINFENKSKKVTKLKLAVDELTQTK